MYLQIEKDASRRFVYKTFQCRAPLGNVGWIQGFLVGNIMGKVAFFGGKSTWNSVLITVMLIIQTFIWDSWYTTNFKFTSSGNAHNFHTYYSCYLQYSSQEGNLAKLLYFALCNKNRLVILSKTKF